MKKYSILSAIAIIITLFLYSCKEDTPTVCVECDGTNADEELYVGDYTGTVSFEVEITPGTKITIPLPTLFTVTNPVSGDGKVSITSSTLDDDTYSILGNINSADCKMFSIDTIDVDTLNITNTPTKLGGLIPDYKPLQIVNFKAGGEGTLSCSGTSVVFTINIATGTIKSPSIALNNLDVSNSTLGITLKK